MDNDLRETLQKELSPLLKGSVSIDHVDRSLYATDASAYREMPLAVICPRDANDVSMVVKYAQKHKVALIPRAGGTSLAGQVVGDGIVVDVSRYFNSIIELNEEERWVKVEPGVVLDELNEYLKSYGLFFGPETSTSNRCCIGGMVGNNSCGSHSLLYGSTRDHLLEVEGYLSNGDFVVFKELQNWEFDKKCQGDKLENHIYRELKELFSDKENVKCIHKEFPHPDIKRRNTGYALDELVKLSPFTEEGNYFNFSKLIAGSEGTLLFVTGIKLNLVDVPAPEKGLLCAQFESLSDALAANLVALKHQPGAIELMDRNVLELTKDNIVQRRNRFFIEGNPAAILLIEFSGQTKEEIAKQCEVLIYDLIKEGVGYAFPIVYNDKIANVWSLRKAGLGVLSNVKGDHRPVSVIEDTAIRPEDLPAFVEEMEAMFEHFGVSCIFHGHAGSGELHLRPVLNLKDSIEVGTFRKIAFETAKVVKRYRGSLSGEHGDGRLRGEFIPAMVGNLNYKMFIRIKEAFDPDEIFNPGKIIDTPPMNVDLRYRLPNMEKAFTPIFDWSKTDGMLRAAEKCNGSGDCRKSELIGGTMCPSFMGTRDEKHSTRGRANILREFFTGKIKDDELFLDDVYDVLDLCLSCKACKAECPSSVDITKLKTEFLQYYYSQKGTPLRVKVFGGFSLWYKIGSLFPPLFNGIINIRALQKIQNKILGIALERQMPNVSKITLKRRMLRHKSNPVPGRTVYLFADEFTNLSDSDIGFKAILLLEKLGYRVVIPQHYASGRSYLSVGLLNKAKRLANRNVERIGNLVSKSHPIIGIEPSAILTLRDEYPELVSPHLRSDAEKLAAATLTIEEFIAREIDKGIITQDYFTDKPKKIRFHGHCYQKALSNSGLVEKVLSFPINYEAEEINSGCCGMAGSFGYEKEHYNLSMKIGELVLLPEVRKTPQDVDVAASGTSCRHQIEHGAGRKALHPIEILYDALK